MICFRCERQPTADELWPAGGRCPDCHDLWLRCVAYQGMKGGVHYDLDRFPHLVVVEIKARALSPTPLIGAGVNGFVIRFPWWIS